MYFAWLVGEFAVHCLTTDHRSLELGRALAILGPRLSFHSEHLGPNNGGGRAGEKLNSSGF